MISMVLPMVLHAEPFGPQSHMHSGDPPGAPAPVCEKVPREAESRSQEKGRVEGKSRGT